MKITAIAVVLLLAGCIPPSAELAMLAPAAAPVPLESVRVIDGSQTGGCTALAQLEEPANDRTVAIEKLKTTAAGIGADALVLGEVREKTTTGNRILYGGLASSDEVQLATAYRCLP